MKRPQRIVGIAGIALALALTFGLGWYGGKQASKVKLTASDAPTERKVLYWHDPMVPGPKFDKPGKSPFMDMQLVPMYADGSTDATGGAPIVTVRPEIANSLGVRTAPVTRGKAGSNALAVPREALIRTGTRTSVVTALGDGRFQPVDVVAGTESGDTIEITKGLKENDRVVVSGQFLIDSDASTRASFMRMETPKTEEEKKP